ncbi:transcription factor bHLH162-like [Mercurialis annua]|uniref:transcription factor bHLH162-like n=1 Tax=Mercurialis annua TaxID=3986 RepID=UPI00215E6E62|nr:transcription factor bHLH162-like [Mercurialis annua]
MTKIMKKINKTESAKLDRKIVERNRRIHMKGLCFKLAALIPAHHFKHYSKDMLSQHDKLDHAAEYIKQLKNRIEKLKKIKEETMRSLRPTDTNKNDIIDEMIMGLILPMVELKESGSSIEVILISGLEKKFMLYQVITILEEEGAEVVSASFSTVGDKVFHTVHAQVKILRVGVETSRVSQRLQELIYWGCM